MNFTSVGIVSFVSLIIGISIGYKYELNQYDRFKSQSESIALVQKEKVKADEQADKQISHSIVSDYNNSLMQYKSSSSGMSSLSRATTGIDERTAYKILVDKCTETTMQLTYLQKWVNQQYEQDHATK